MFNGNRDTRVLAIPNKSSHIIRVVDHQIITPGALSPVTLQYTSVVRSSSVAWIFFLL